MDFDIFECCITNDLFLFPFHSIFFHLTMTLVWQLMKYFWFHLNFGRRRQKMPTFSHIQSQVDAGWKMNWKCLNNKKAFLKSKMAKEISLTSLFLFYLGTQRDSLFPAVSFWKSKHVNIFIIFGTILWLVLSVRHDVNPMSMNMILITLIFTFYFSIQAII